MYESGKNQHERHDALAAAFHSATKNGDMHLAQYKEWPVSQKEVAAPPKKRSIMPRTRRAATLRESIQLPKRDEHIFGDLWDVPDARFLEKVQCKALVQIMQINPKLSTFEIRMTCHWKFRSQHGEERTETRLRVPGIRMPGLLVTVDESRIWRDMEKAKASTHSVFWRGISVFTLQGFERFEVYDFPFDRQILRLDLLEFVWRSEKDSTDHDFSMHLCALQLETESMLPEWAPSAAYVHAECEMEQATMPKDCEHPPPTYCSRFTVLLRVERKNWYYVIQVFGLTILITIFSSFPLGMPCTSEYLGDRLSTYTGGLLTLTAFKYGIADKLPSVPYSTKFDWIIFFEMMSLIAMALEALIVYRTTDEDHAQVGVHSHYLWTARGMNLVEDVIGVFVVLGWLFFWFYLAADQLHLSWFPFGIKPKTWLQTLADQDEQEMYQDQYEDQEEDVPAEVRELKQDWEVTNKEIMLALKEECTPDKTQDEIAQIQTRARRKREERDRLEMQMLTRKAMASRGQE